jgi:hypothetical protein
VLLRPVVGVLNPGVVVLVPGVVVPNPEAMPGVAPNAGVPVPAAPGTLPVPLAVCPNEALESAQRTAATADERKILPFRMMEFPLQ